jgi:hypothetical protein
MPINIAKTLCVIAYFTTSQVGTRLPARGAENAAA